MDFKALTVMQMFMQNEQKKKGKIREGEGYF